MILDELVLHNLGVFSGEHRLTLTPSASRRPIILLGGLNGAGKTTIRDALYLVLYGPLAQSTTRRGSSYESYLRSLISRDRNPASGAAVELAFHAHREGRVNDYRVARSWYVSGRGVREQLVVYRDGQRDQALTDTWAEQVESFLPRGVAGLFFFDGEQIEALADLERSREVLRSALNSLLGLDLVDRLDADLAVLRRRHAAKSLPSELRDQLASAQAVATAARQVEEAKKLAVAGARVDLERANKAQFAATERYRAAGGDRVEEREQTERRLAEVQAELARLDSELREAAAGATPLLLVGEQLRELAKRAELESEALRDKAIVGVLEERDREVVQRLKTGKVPTSVVRSLEEHLVFDRLSRQRNADAELVSGLAGPEGPAYVVERVLPDVRRQLEQLLGRRRELEAAMVTTEHILAAIPEAEALLPLVRERDDARDELLRAEAVLAKAEEELDAARTDLDRADRTHEKILEKATAEGFSADDSRRLVEHADRVRATLEAVKIAATRRHTNRISAFVLDGLQRLLHKRNLISQLRINPESLAVELTGSDGSVVEPEALSAGERQLLAVALLWGLAQASGQPLPVVIDTPLGRLDRGHRRYLLERYFPQVSHQVVLLSTDTEIDEEAYKKLKPHVDKAYTLVFDEASATTTVRPGYFREG